MMDKKILVGLIFIIILVSGMIYYMSKPVYPVSVNMYKYRYKQMNDSEQKKTLLNYTETILNDPIKGLSYTELIRWEHKYLTYTEQDLAQPRPELPIPILERGLGRCGEFALLYIGSLLANNVSCRLIMDCSRLQNKSKSAAGDHVWIEVYTNNKWVHVDPTEKVIGEPTLYCKKWNKDVNLVYAIDETGITDVTKKYA